MSKVAITQMNFYIRLNDAYYLDSDELNRSLRYF